MLNMRIWLSAWHKWTWMSGKINHKDTHPFVELLLFIFESLKLPGLTEILHLQIFSWLLVLIIGFC